MEVKVLKHECKKSGYFIKHKALVEIEGVDREEDREEMIDNTSIAVGYHPYGHGVYGGTISKSSKENQYIIVWDTGTSCD